MMNLVMQMMMMMMLLLQVMFVKRIIIDITIIVAIAICIVARIRADDVAQADGQRGLSIVGKCTEILIMVSVAIATVRTRIWVP